MSQYLDNEAQHKKQLADKFLQIVALSGKTIQKNYENKLFTSYGCTDTPFIEDCYSNAMLRVYDSICRNGFKHDQSSYKTIDEAFTAYFYTALLNQFLAVSERTNRKGKKEVKVEAIQHDLITDSDFTKLDDEEILADLIRQDYQYVVDTINGMNEKYRTLLTKRFIEGMTNDQLAKFYNVNNVIMKNRVCFTKNTLLQALKINKLKIWKK